MSRKVKVCVVDDHVQSAKVLCEGLRLHSYEAFEAYSGSEALEVCAREKVDLVLLDIGLPDIDGYEVCRRLKESPITKDAAVIFVTAKGQPEDVSKGYKLGASDYVTKPFNLPMVMVRVEAVMRHKNIIDSLQTEEVSLDAYGYTDSLTGLKNRRYLMERLQEEVDKAHRYDVPMACVVIDVDEIEAVDPESGPVSTDDLLSEIALSFRSLTRAHDVLARYDGTVFAAILPHTSLNHALGYVTNIVDEVEGTTFSDPNFPTRVGLSIGVVSCRNGSAKSADAIFGEAMRSLLQAKNRTENRIVGRELEVKAS